MHSIISNVKGHGGRTMIDQPSRYVTYMHVFNNIVCEGTRWALTTKQLSLYMYAYIHVYNNVVCEGTWWAYYG